MRGKVRKGGSQSPSNQMGDIRRNKGKSSMISLLVLI